MVAWGPHRILTSRGPSVARLLLVLLLVLVLYLLGTAAAADKMLG
jgi:hypothetical protein